MTVNEIRDEVNRLLVREFPGVTVDIQLSAGDFQRPAFYLEADHRQPDNVNFCTVEEKSELLVKYLGVLDERGQPDAQELSEVRDRLLALFPLGRLQVGDRSIRCRLDSGVDLDGAWLQLSCTWWEDRPQPPAPEVMRELTMKTTSA